MRATAKECLPCRRWRGDCPLRGCSLLLVGLERISRAELRPRRLRRVQDLVEPLEVVAGDCQFLSGPVQPLADSGHDSIRLALLVRPLPAAGPAVAAGAAAQWADERSAAPLAGPQVCFLLRK